MINWKVRIRNKTFWLAIIPAVIILVQAVAQVFGYKISFGDLQENLIEVVNAFFAILAILGVVVDPTTNGIGDSERALGYEEPWKD